MRPTRSAAAAVLGGALLATAGCGLFWESPDVDIATVDIVSVGLAGATAEVGLRVANPNGFELRAEEIRYALEFQEDGGDRWRTVADAATERRLTVAARDTARIMLEVPFRYADVGAAVLSLLREGRLEYRVRGDIRFDAPVGSLRVPFEDRGRLEP